MYEKPHCQASHSPDQDLNPGPPEYKQSAVHLNKVLGCYITTVQRQYELVRIRAKIKFVVVVVVVIHHHHHHHHHHHRRRRRRRRRHRHLEGLDLSICSDLRVRRTDPSTSFVADLYTQSSI
jgi:hypothetical protein